jgi:GDPmannose 4,6-dehydratase
MKKALILGIGGQDGSYLADILLEKGYEVHGFIRRSSTGNLGRVQHSLDRIQLHHGDLLDSVSIYRTLTEVKPDEIYNEADQDHVGWSYSTPAYSMAVTAGAVATLLESVKQVCPEARVFQPCSAMMFGHCLTWPQNELTPFNPQSPYACAKVAAYHLARYYRNVHGMFVCTAILYNHDSPRRTEEYLLHQICEGVKRVAMGEQEKVAIGNMEMLVDIGYAKEYMQAAWKMMQLPSANDYIIGSGEACCIRVLLEHACKIMDLDWQEVYVHNPKFSRAGNPSTLVADAAKAMRDFDFRPEFNAVEMVNYLMDGNRA